MDKRHRNKQDQKKNTSTAIQECKTSVVRQQKTSFVSTCAVSATVGQTLITVTMDYIAVSPDLFHLLLKAIRGVQHLFRDAPLPVSTCVNTDDA